MPLQSNKVLSAQMQQAAESYWLRLIDLWPEALSLTDSQQSEIKTIFSLSDYIAEQLNRHPEWIPELFNGLLHEVVRADFDKELHQILTDLTTEDQVKSALRQYRNKQMVRLAWRDFANYSKLEDSLVDLSSLAEALVIAARDWLYLDLCKQLGTPSDAEGKPQPLLIAHIGYEEQKSHIDTSAPLVPVFHGPIYASFLHPNRSI